MLLLLLLLMTTMRRSTLPKTDTCMMTNEGDVDDGVKKGTFLLLKI